VEQVRSTTFPRPISPSPPHPEKATSEPDLDLILVSSFPRLPPVSRSSSARERRWCWQREGGQGSDGGEQASNYGNGRKAAPPPTSRQRRLLETWNTPVSLQGEMKSSPVLIASIAVQICGIFASIAC
jgi:hypothetical protein